MSLSENAKCEISDLPRVKDRLTFLYLEHCVLTCKASSLCVKSAELQGNVYVPIATFLVLMIGPGVTISSDAMHLCGDVGVTLLWVGEQGVRLYATGRPLTVKSKYLDAQVKYYTHQQRRLQVEREMFRSRFPNDDVSTLSHQDLQLREASRVKRLYQEYANMYDISFRRDYDVDNFADGDDVNKALSAGNVCLYGLCHAVIEALGMSPALGFVHRSHALSFVYDIGDLYKHEITIPLAFELGSQHVSDIGNVVRRRCRDIFAEKKLVKRIVHDLQHLFGFDETEVDVLNVVDLRGE